MTSRMLAAAGFVLLATAAAYAAEPWQQPWADVKSDSAHKCAKIFDTFQLQAVCMDNETKGYEQMKKY